MEQSDTFFPRFAGTPNGFRHVGFRFPNDAPLAALVEMPGDWDVTVYVEKDTYRTFIVGVSPDNEGLLILRGLRNHAPKEVRYATAAEQAAALGGKTAASATQEELVEAARAELTDLDQPAPVAPPVLNLVEATADEARPDRPNGRPQRPRFRDYRFRQQQLSADKNDTRAVVDCHTNPTLSLVTKSEEGKLVKAYKNGRSEMFFLFDEGAEYLLECVTGRFRSRRLEARSAKAVHAGQQPNEIVTALIPSLSKSS